MQALQPAITNSYHGNWEPALHSLDTSSPPPHPLPPMQALQPAITNRYNGNWEPTLQAAVRSGYVQARQIPVLSDDFVNCLLPSTSVSRPRTSLQQGAGGASTKSQKPGMHPHRIGSQYVPCQP